MACLKPRHGRGGSTRGDPYAAIACSGSETPCPGGRAVAVAIIHSMRARCRAPGEPLPPVVLTGLPRDQGVRRGTGRAGLLARMQMSLPCARSCRDPRRWRCPSASGPPAVPVGAGEQRTGPSWAVSAPDRAPGVSATDRPMQGAGSPATTTLCCQEGLTDKLQHTHSPGPPRGTPAWPAACGSVWCPGACEEDEGFTLGCWVPPAAQPGRALEVTSGWSKSLF